MKRKIFTMLSILMLSACSMVLVGYSGTQYDLEKLKVGLTTSAEVERFYGGPAILELNQLAVRYIYYFKTPEAVVDTRKMIQGSYTRGCKDCGRLVLAFARKENKNVLSAYSVDRKDLRDRFAGAMTMLQRGDYSDARPVLESLAAEHYSDSEFNLALMYINGDGGSRDYSRARVLLSSAAATGHVGALYDLGAMLRNAEGGPKDVEAAKMYFAEAASRHHKVAAAELAGLYREEGDLKKAEYWTGVAEGRINP